MQKTQVDPWWQQSLEKRSSVYANDSALRVAYFYPKPTASTFRYRAYNMIEALERSDREDVVASWFSMKEIRALLNLLPQLDILVLVRTPLDSDIADLIAKARLNGVKLVFDCDDLVFDPKYAFTAAINNSLPVEDTGELDRWFAYVSRLNATAQSCDAGIATNDYLAEKLAVVVPGPTSAIGNFLNHAQESVSQELLQDKIERNHIVDDTFTVGYFSGSKTHRNDFLMVSDIIAQMLSEYKNLRLKLVGYVELTAELLRFGERVSHKSYVNWLDLQKDISEVDLNIAPLQSNPFAFSKSELKYFEAAVVGTYSCVSSSYCFDRAVPSKDLGLVVRDGNWSSALQCAFDYVVEWRERKAGQLLLAQHAQSRWSSVNFGHKLADVLADLADC